MPQTDVKKLEHGDITNVMEDYEINPIVLDGAGSQEETEWINKDFTTYMGYYKSIPELRAVIDAKATWTIGKGFIADEVTTMLLDNIRGWGVDTFDTILENMVRTMLIGGDSFAEIILDDEDNLINLKPLDPSSIKIIVDRKGIIKRYEQINKISKAGEIVNKFKPEEILHLSRNRVGDEIHGISMVESLKEIILMRNEAMTDWRRVMHRNVDPVWIFHLDTDDEEAIAKIKAKMDSARGKGENMYIPKDAVIPEQIAVAPNASLNPLPWIESLNNYFFQAAGVPQIIVGGSGEFTEATAKIAYLAFQQTIEEDQLYIEEQILSQLNLYINLEFPASLENELLSDTKKDGRDMTIQPNEMTAGEGQ